MNKDYLVLKIAYKPPFSHGMLKWVEDTITASATSADETSKQYNFPYICNEIQGSNIDTHFFTGHDEILMNDLIKKEIGYIEF